MVFWIAAAGIGLAVTALLLLALLRGSDTEEPSASYDLRVYRDQLREIERDVARGVVPDDEAERLRTEISRRVLDADRAMAADGGGMAAPRGVTLAMGLLVAAVMLGGVWTYLRLGAPGYPDMPVAERLARADELYRSRPPQAAAEAATADATLRQPEDPEFAQLMDRLRAALRDRPNDLEGHRLLAQNEAALGNYAAAAEAQRRVIALLAGAATAEDHALLAEAMILAAGGYVSPQAEAELVRALALDPLDGTATFYAGLMFAQTGRPDRTMGLWTPLLERSTPDDPWVGPIRDQIGRIAAEAGIDYTLPAAAVGPTEADIAAAAEMAPEDREAMIRGMVAQLGERLASEGGTAADWARLIGAQGILGETEAARAVWTEAQQRFAGREADLAVVRAAAEAAGVVQ